MERNDLWRTYASLALLGGSAVLSQLYSRAENPTARVLEQLVSGVLICVALVLVSAGSLRKRSHSDIYADVRAGHQRPMTAPQKLCVVIAIALLVLQCRQSLGY